MIDWDRWVWERSLATEVLIEGIDLGPKWRVVDRSLDELIPLEDSIPGVMVTREGIVGRIVVVTTPLEEMSIRRALLRMGARLRGWIVEWIALLDDRPGCLDEPEVFEFTDAFDELSIQGKSQIESQAFEGSLGASFDDVVGVRVVRSWLGWLGSEDWIE